MEKVESGESNISTEAASRLTYKQVWSTSGINESKAIGPKTWNGEIQENQDQARTEKLSKSLSTRLNLYFQIERDQKKTTSQLEGKKLESASRLGMGLGGLR